MIDVMQEGVERAHALLDADGEPAPFGGGEDARDDIEGDQPFGGLFLAIDREGDAEPAEDASASFWLRIRSTRDRPFSQAATSA